MDPTSNLVRMAAVAYLYDNMNELPVWFRSLTPGRLADVADVIVRCRLPIENHTFTSMEEFEKRELLRVITLCNGNITKAAGLLQMGKTTVYNKLKKWGYSVQNLTLLEQASALAK
jgi:DNA-binding NtrC family response regulator